MTKKYELENVTPESMLCGGDKCCPRIYKVKDVTPKEMSCIIGNCQSIYQTNESYLIIGKKITSKDAGLEGKVGKDEVLIEVPRKLIDERKK